MHFNDSAQPHNIHWALLPGEKIIGSSPISGNRLLVCSFRPACSSPISGTREPQSISFSLLASFLAKRAPYREPHSARPHFLLSLLPAASSPMHCAPPSRARLAGRHGPLSPGRRVTPATASFFPSRVATHEGRKEGFTCLPPSFPTARQRKRNGGGGGG